MLFSVFPESLKFDMENTTQPYLRRQAQEILEGGIREAVRKLGALIENCVAPFLAVAIRALRPLVLIRVGLISSHTYGAYAVCTEVYLCEKDAGLHGKRVFDIFVNDGRGLSNKQLKKMWRRALPMPVFNGLFDKVWRLLPEQHSVPFRDVDRDLDIHSLMPRSGGPHIRFSKREEASGREELFKLGVPDGVPFVCFHARDTAYTKTMMPDGEMQEESNFRNCNIENYMEAIKAVTDRGSYALRMGSMVERPLPMTGPQVLDYATIGRTDFLDVYLGANCRYFIGSTGGAFAVAQIFGKPLVLTNYALLFNVYSYGANVIFIPKRLWSQEKQRPLTFREIIQTDVSDLRHSQQFDELGINHQENTAGEIAAVVVEMEDRLSGDWEGTTEDEQLQEKFWSLYPTNNAGGAPQARIGAQFLRENQYLLE